MQNKISQNSYVYRAQLVAMQQQFICKRNCDRYFPKFDHSPKDLHCTTNNKF